MSMTENTEKNSQFTTVKTAYARVAVLLLAINFCLTGYVVYSMNKTTQAQLDQIVERPSSTAQTLGTSGKPAKPSSIETRETDQ